MKRTSLQKGNGRQRRFRFIHGLFLGSCATLFIVHSAFGWSSTETLGAFTTHQFLNVKAHELLIQHPMLKKGYIKFPSISEIDKYSGVRPIVSGNGIEIDGEGPDNPKNSDFADHYFNPSLGQNGLGGGPAKADEMYAGLKRSIEPLIDTSLKPPAYYAAHLGHYVQDMTCPFHVLGAPSGYFNYDPKVIGPYARKYGAGIWEGQESLYKSQKAPTLSAPATPSTASSVPPENYHYKVIDPLTFWNLMVDRFKKEKSRGANWFEPNYYNGPLAWTYQGTHFLYEAAVGPYHNPFLDVAMSPREATNIRKQWYSSNTNNTKRAGNFARSIAIETKGRLDREDKEFMFDPSKMVKPPGNVPIPHDAWCRAVQATYTVWRASFSALFVDQNTDVKLAKVSINPDKYKFMLKIKNMEPEEDASNVQARVILKAGDKRFDFGKTPIQKIIKGRESDWLDCDGEVEGISPERGGVFYITVTGNYYNVPDAGETYFVYSVYGDPIEGLWRLKGAKYVTEVEIRYNPRTQTHEARMVEQGVFKFHPRSTMLLGSVRPLEGPVMQSVPSKVRAGKLYEGTEHSWQPIKKGSEVLKGPETRTSVRLILDGNNLEYWSKDQTFYWERIR